jgi:hypothetical protein
MIRTYSTRLIHGKQCKPDIHKSQYQIGKALSTHPLIGNADGTKRYKMLFLTMNVDDECAYAQLIADIILL